MKLTTFIKRPILSAVVSVLIVLIGAVGLASLPVEQYPDIAPPTVEVSAYFYGADAFTCLNSVITPLEDAINGVEHMIYMTSTAYNSGEVSINVVFAQGTDPDMAAVNVQNRVQKALSLLPAEVTSVGVEVEKRQNSMLQIFAISSPDDTYDFNFLCNYADINVKSRLMRVNGVGKFLMVGEQYSMRIWLDPAKMAQHNLNPSEVTAMLKAQNLEAATGTLGQDSDETYQYTMRYTGRLKSQEEFKDIVLRSDKNGDILRLKDVADIELGIRAYNYTDLTDGHPSAICIIFQAAGSNATEVNNTITRELEQIKKEAPSGIDVVSMMNTNDFLYASIDQVVSTLRDALILVILIVLMFLKDFRSTLIPFISIMVSLIGTFAFMMAAGFSINLLTLFALVLVIGTVVDDSIVVVEAVHTQFDKGVASPYEATKKALDEVLMPVLTSSLVFMAVFIPVSFTGGTSGVFYRQFGLTMAVAVGISALNALTTVPALCSLLLRPLVPPQPGQKMTLKQKYSVWFDGFFERFGTAYTVGVKKLIPRKPVVWLLIAGTAALLVFCMVTMPGGLVPDEDKAVLIVEASLPPGSSLHSSKDIILKLSDEIDDMEGIKSISVLAGYGFVSGANPSVSSIVCRLDDWSKRGARLSQDRIRERMLEVCSKYKSLNCVVFSTPMIPGYGTTSDVEMYVQDRRGGSVDELYQVTQDFLGAIYQRGLFGYSSFTLDYPQWQVKVDAAKCIRSGLTPQQVLSAVGTYFGGSYISDFNLYGKVYKVMMEARPDDRRDEFALDATYIKTADGKMAPLSSFVDIDRIYGPDALRTFNMFTSINVNVSSSTKSSGEIMQTLHECAETTLPDGYTIDFAGMSREQDSQGGLGLILSICVFVIYLILAALYESLVLPFAVLLALPVGLAASYGVSEAFGLDNNIYLQTGVIMLIGLISKTAILITEHAVKRHEEGMDIVDAACDAAKVRLRPILMTASTMVIGLLPLLTSLNGVGGHGNFSLGLGTIAGMLIGTTGLLYVTPVLYTTFQKMHDKMQKQTVDFKDDED